MAQSNVYYNALQVFTPVLAWWKVRKEKERLIVVLGVDKSTLKI